MRYSGNIIMLFRYITNAKSSYGDPKPEDKGQSEWQVDLFDCFKEPCLSKFGPTNYFFSCNLFVFTAQ